jgi:hypothetical protein
VLTNQQLRDMLLSSQMECYFQRKLADVPREELGPQIEECLKFLSIARHCRGSIPVTPAIDEVWHLWILETMEYSRLCASLGDGTYIHHTSNVFTQCAGEAPPDNTLEEDVATLGTYVLNFGPFEEGRVKYWRMASYLVTHGGMRLADLNSWLATGASTPSTA